MCLHYKRQQGGRAKGCLGHNRQQRLPCLLKGGYLQGKRQAKQKLIALRIEEERNEVNPRHCGIYAKCL